MITLAGQAFTGPFMLPLWSASKHAGVFAVMVPGWRLNTFRALHFDQAEALAPDSLRAHARYAEWLTIAGTEWNLYVAAVEMSFSTQAQRRAFARDAQRSYRPEFQNTDHDAPSLRTMLLAQAMRENKG